MIKKVFITAIVFFVIALAIGGYLLFFKKDATTTPPDTIDPFGLGSNDRPLPTATSTDGQGSGIVTPSTVRLSAVTQISANPATLGFAFNKGSTTLVRFVERAQGHITEVNMSSGTTSLLSITTLPKIQDTLWLNNGNNVIYRYISEVGDIRTYTAAIPLTIGSGTPSIKGSFITGSIEEVVASPDLKKILILEGTYNSARGVIANADGSGRKELFTLPISEWIVSWPEATTIVVTSKASSGFSGYTYIINATTGSMRKALGPINALTTITNPSASYIAYTNNNGSLSVYDVKKGTSIGTEIKTYVDKCVWSKKNKGKLFCAVPRNVLSGSIPDDWYKGKVGYSDNLYEINVASSTATIFPAEKNITSQGIDVSGITLSTNEQYLLLTNKRDLSLWAVNLSL
jgi:hypothetical protein